VDVERVAFIGLGAMGRAMARNVQAAGFPLAVYNRTAATAGPFAQAGASVHGTPREAAAAADVVVTMVTDPVALAAVVEGADGAAAGMGPGQVLINMSTVSHEATLTTAATVQKVGAAFVDAPVSGTVKPAEDGTLVVLAGAEAADLERVRPVLEAMGKEVVHCGPVGQGTRMKLVLNLMLGNMMQALAEGLSLGKGFDLEPEAVLQALGSGALGAPMYQVKGQAIENRTFAKQFPVHLMFKDLNLVLEAAGETGTPLPQTAATRECFNAAMAQGLGDEDMAAVYKTLRSLAGR